MKCASLIRTCRECGWKAQGAKVETCPECGADMHCGQNAVDGYTRCGYHGAPNPKNNFYGKGKLVTGASSQFPLTRLAARYNKQVTDGRVLSNRAAIDVLDIRLTQLAERIDVEEAPERVAKLYGLWTEYKELRNSNRLTEEVLKRRELDLEFDKIYHDYEAWRQIVEIFDVRRKMVESEVKILKEIKAIMTAEDAYELTAKLLAAVIRVIDDPQKLKQVQYEFRRIIGEPSDRASEGPGETNWGERRPDGGEEGPGDMDQEELLHS